MRQSLVHGSHENHSSGIDHCAIVELLVMHVLFPHVLHYFPIYMT